MRVGRRSGWASVAALALAGAACDDDGGGAAQPRDAGPDARVVTDAAPDAAPPQADATPVPDMGPPPDGGVGPDAFTPEPDAAPWDPDPGPAFVPVQFPPGFWWGTALATWQAEGDQRADGSRVRSNWYDWTTQGRSEGEQNPFGSGFYTLYAEDFARAAALGHDTFRLGLDWARIEPLPGEFDQAEIDHYLRVLDSARDHGLRPVVTLYHWVVPAWVQSTVDDVDMLGVSDGRFVDAFEAFVRHMVPRIKDKVDIYTVLNEPIVPVALGYLQGQHPPGKVLAFDNLGPAALNLVRAHVAATRAIRELDDADADGDGQATFVGVAMSTNPLEPLNPDSPADVAAAEQLNWLYMDWFLEAVVEGELDIDFDRTTTDPGTDPPEGVHPELAGHLDFIGVQYYFTGRARGAPIPRLGGLPLGFVREYDATLPHSDLGNEIRADGMRAVFDRYRRFDLPFVVTEHGTADDQDRWRGFLTLEHLYVIAELIAEGYDIRGYLHWSLTDNFEWHFGRAPRFGLYRVDYDDPAFGRTPTSGVDAMRDIVQAGGITREIWRAHALPAYPTDTRDVKSGYVHERWR